MRFLISAVIVPKEIGARLGLVNPNIPARVHARSRADNRLQSMTFGAAALGIAATGVFAYAAALTYSGKTTTANAAGPQSGFNDGQQAPSTNSGESNGSDSQGIINQFFGGQQVTPPTTTRHRSHTVTGGS